MTDWLIRHFVANYQNTADTEVRTAYGRLASVASIVCNIVLFFGKGVVGFLVGSVAILADAANSITDAASNVVALLGFKLAAKPPDTEHPFGHGRYEYLTTLCVSLLVVLIGVNLVRDAIVRIVRPQPVTFDGVVVTMLVVGVAMKLWMAHLNATLGRRIGSGVLAATAADSRADAIATAVVLATQVASHATGLALDGWAGVGVGAYIVWNGVTLVRDTVGTLLGRAPDPALVTRVRQRVMATPGVLGMHDLMVHDYGPGRLYASAHVEMAPDGNVVEDHELLDGIERDLWESEGLVITLHLDPLERGAEMIDCAGTRASEGDRTPSDDGATRAADAAQAHARTKRAGGAEERAARMAVGIAAHDKPVLEEGRGDTMARVGREGRAYKAKQMIVMRRDLRMRKGKIAAQAAHACVEATLMALVREDRLGQVRVTADESWVWLDDAESGVTPLSNWFDAGVAKVCVYVDGEDALLELAAHGRRLGFACALVRDAGITEFHGEATYTCLAFEPLYPEQIDPLTGELPLY